MNQNTKERGNWIAQCPYCDFIIVTEKPDYKHICKKLMDIPVVSTKEEILANPPELPIMNFYLQKAKKIPKNS